MSNNNSTYQDVSQQLIPYDLFYNISSFSDYETSKNISMLDKTLNQLINKKFLNKKYLEKYKPFTNKIPITVNDYIELYEDNSTDLYLIEIILNDPNIDFLEHYRPDFVINTLFNIYVENKNSSLIKCIYLLNKVIKHKNFNINAICWIHYDIVYDTYADSDKFIYNFLIKNGYKANKKQCKINLDDINALKMRYYIGAGIDPNIFNKTVASSYLGVIGARFDLEDIEYMLIKGSDPTRLLHEFLDALNINFLQSVDINKNVIELVDINVFKLILDYGAKLNKKDEERIRRYINIYTSIEKDEISEKYVSRINEQIKKAVE